MIRGPFCCWPILMRRREIESLRSEDGQQQLAARHFEKAEAYFDLMKQVSDDPWPVLLLADTHAAAGNRKLAIGRRAAATCGATFRESRGLLRLDEAG